MAGCWLWNLHATRGRVRIGSGGGGLLGLLLLASAGGRDGHERQEHGGANVRPELASELLQHIDDQTVVRPFAVVFHGHVQRKVALQVAREQRHLEVLGDVRHHEAGFVRVPVTHTVR